MVTLDIFKAFNVNKFLLHIKDCCSHLTFEIEPNGTVAVLPAWPHKTFKLSGVTGNVSYTLFVTELKTN